MAKMSIHDLQSAGSELFQDCESYLKELVDADLQVQGGMLCTYPWILFTIIEI